MPKRKCQQTYHLSMAYFSFQMAKSSHGLWTLQKVAISTHTRHKHHGTMNKTSCLKKKIIHKKLYKIKLLQQSPTSCPGWSNDIISKKKGPTNHRSNLQRPSHVTGTCFRSQTHARCTASLWPPSMLDSSNSWTSVRTVATPPLEAPGCGTWRC